jgi:hypothetical protein
MTQTTSSKIPTYWKLKPLPYWNSISFPWSYLTSFTSRSDWKTRAVYLCLFIFCWRFQMSQNADVNTNHGKKWFFPQKIASMALQ